MKQMENFRLSIASLANTDKMEWNLYSDDFKLTTILAYLQNMDSSDIKKGVKVKFLHIKTGVSPIDVGGVSKAISCQINALFKLHTC